MYRVIGKFLVLVLIGLSWIYAISRTIPEPLAFGIGDYGFFLGVADRLRAGDALYADVWDNKDPFLFYSLAVARSAGPLGGWLLEGFWVFVTALASVGIARTLGVSPWMRALIGLAAVPFIVVGVPYFMGTSHLPGVALTLICLGMALDRRWVLSGVVVGFVIFFKLIMLPLAIALVAVVFMGSANPSSDRWRRFVRFAAGLGGTVVVIALVMAWRGEFVGFLETQVRNVVYSQSPIVSADQTGLMQQIAQHVVILINPHVFAIILSTALVVVAVYVNQVCRTKTWVHGLSSEWWLTSVALIVAVGTIFVAGKWLHHAEILVVSSTLALTMVAVYAKGVLAAPSWVVAPILVALSWPLAGIPGPDGTAMIIRESGLRWARAQATDLLTVELASREPTSFALVGQGNLVPRTGQLNGWDLVCRHIAQRPFDPEVTFRETIDCLPAAETVIVTNDYGPDPAFPGYSRFVDDVEILLREQYTCEVVPNFRICTRDVKPA